MGDRGVVQHALEVAVDLRVRAERRPGEPEGLAVVRLEGRDDESDEDEEEDDVHGRKSARIVMLPRVAEPSMLDKILPML